MQRFFYIVQNFCFGYNHSALVYVIFCIRTVSYHCLAKIRWNWHYTMQFCY